MKKYLIIDKKQRIKLKKKYPTAVRRIMEELDKKHIQYDFAYNHQIAITLKNNHTTITANQKDITDYTHILFRGHHLHKPKEYYIKRIIIDHIDAFNANVSGNRSKKQKNHIQNETNKTASSKTNMPVSNDNTQTNTLVSNNNTQSNTKPRKIKVQNSEAIKLIPYYDKVYMMLLFARHGLPYFDSYYRMDGNYRKHRGPIKYPLIIKNYSGVNDIRMIDGKRKIKKNVYKVDKAEDFDQKYLKEKDHTDFYIQQFSNQHEDFRIFVAKGKVIGGWKRKATKGFMTVLHGKYEMYNNPPDELRKIAEKTAKVLKADFIAVDFMFINDKPYIQEISLHPGFKAYETKIKGEPINIAKTIIESF